MLGSLSLNFSISSHTKNIVRSIFGVVICMLIALELDLMAPQVSAIFAIMLLTKGSENLGIKKSLGAILVIFALGLVGLFIGGFIRDYALISILLLSLVIFWSFRLVRIPEPLRMMFLMFTLTFPFLSLTAEPLAYLVFSDLLICLVISLVITQLAFIFFPDDTPKQAQTLAQKEKSITYNYDKVATNGLIMLLPIMLFFFYFQLNAYVITFVYIIILGLDPLIYRSTYPYIAIFANLLGGLAAFLAYNLLIIAPDFYFYIALICAAAIFFTYNIFSDKKSSTVFYPMAYRAFFLVLSIIFSSSDSVGENLSARLFGILLAIIYVVLAYQFLNLINNPIKHDKEKV